MTGAPPLDTSPRVSAARLQQFLDSYGVAEFRHAGALVPLLRRDDPDEARISAREAQLDDELRAIYRMRVRTTAAARPSPFYPPGLADDVHDLVVALDAANDQPLCFWNIRMPSGVCYVVFELLEDRLIAGCVMSADQRIVNPR